MVLTYHLSWLKLRLLLTPVLLVWALSCVATEQVQLDHTNLGERIGLHIKYFEDPDGMLTIDAILDQQSQFIWHPSTQEVPNFGYTQSAYWFKFTLKNQTSDLLRRDISVDYPLLDEIDFYSLIDNQITDHIVTGDIYPFHNRKVKHRNFLFPVTVPANAELNIVLRVKTSGSMQLPIGVWEEKNYLFEDQKEILRKSLFYGALAVMILYNLFLFASLREASYMFYVLFVMAFLTTQAAMHGVLFQYVWPDSPRLQELAILVGVPANVLFTSLFANSFLSLKTYASRMYKFFNGTAMLGLFAIIGAFFLPYGISTRISVALVIPVCVACLAIGPYLWSKGHRISRFYTLAWAFMVSGSSLLALNKFGLVPSNFVTENGLQLGATLEAIFLSFALADRLNEERSQRTVAQQSLLDEMEQRRIIETKRIYEATHNHLTKFPNKAFMESRLKEVFTTAFKAQSFDLVFMHLTRFHEINKTLGHHSADQLLVLLTEKLNQRIGDINGIIPIEENDKRTDYIAVIGGVAIVYLVESFARHQDVHIKNIIKEFETIDFNALSLELNIKAGVATYPDQGADPKALIRNAQIAVDVAEQKRDTIVWYDENTNPYSEKRLTLVGDLRRALKQDKLMLYFQPQICFKQQRVTGLEALLRWTHEEHGFIPPDEFIPLAEQTGLINEITSWVVEKAAEKLAKLNRDGYSLSVSVNISALNLREKEFPERVQRIIQTYGIIPDRMVLEVTETATMDDPEQALLALKRLKLTGVRLSIDDFGTGYSSLNYIKRLPVNEIKIDRSFVMEMDEDSDDIVIVKTTINMCHDLGYTVVAEGVEKESVLQQLSEMGCDVAQGYYLSRPLPFEELQDWLAHQEKIIKS